MTEIRCKRIYDTPSEEDGFRVLVDRLWPRGISRKKAAIDAWEKEISPSSELRKWFSHDPEKYAGFCSRYHEELNENKDAAQFAQMCASKLEDGNVTFLYAAKDAENNNAEALKDWAAERIRP